MSCAPLTREDARGLVAQVRKENGGISPEDETFLRTNYPDVLEALQNVRRKLGSATKTLATDLYSKDTRFLYELIQNAEDNQYTKGDTPRLDFSLYPDKIVIDSNEDGFSAENFKAICSTGESTKTKTQGYVGEKGIGFKSVFKVAKKVHIQSEPFSFSFTYTRDSDDDGLGMVTPFNESYEDLPPGVRTRMTLTLLRPSDFAQRAQELSSLPHTLLLFLSKIESINVRILSEDENPSEIKFSYSREAGNVELIQEQIKKNGQTALSQTQRFHVTRRIIRNLPYDAERQHTDQATVVLAFPVDEHDTPILQNQHVFAYLPLRQVGLKFLIQADFVTQASREDVFDSPRNEALLVGVAEAFRDAVLGFCEHPTLQYQWMRYLPDESISDEFWKRLKPKIEDLLSITPILRSWTGRRLYVPGRLRLVSTDFLDQNNEPLFADLTEEIYLAPEYEFPDFQTLRSLGTRRITVSEAIARVEADLQRKDSRVRTSTANADWDSRAAHCIAEHFNPNRDHPIDKRIKSLPVIPLRQSLWASANTSDSQQIYFPTIGESEIPTDLDFLLVEPLATHNASRVKLFSLLGVKECDPGVVIRRIYDKHLRLSLSSSISINFEHSAQHLVFLFRYEAAGIPLKGPLFLFAQRLSRDVAINAEKETIYFSEQYDECGPGQLFGKTILGPGFDAYLLPDRYRYYISAFSGRSWDTWLEKFLRIHRIPQINNSGKPSEALKYILEHRSDKLIQLLRKNWSTYAPQMTEEIESAIREARVPTEGGFGFGFGPKVSLKGTYVPSRCLKGLANELHAKPEIFLQMPSGTKQSELEKSWKFLERFGVGFTDDVQFYLHILSRLPKSSDSSCGYDCHSAFKVYDRLMNKCVSEEDASRIRIDFQMCTLVIIPGSSTVPSRWLCMDQCVWDGPDWLAVKPRLSGIEGYSGLEQFFRVILKMKDAVWQDSLAELRSMKEKQESNHQKASEIYRSLWRDFKEDSNFELLRSEFEKDELIFVPERNKWHPPSHCLWAPNEVQVQIHQKIFIGTQHASLLEFFTRMLGVQESDAIKHIQALKDLSKIQPPAVAQIKESIAMVSSFNPPPASLSGLWDLNILPVKLPSGEVILTSASVDFAIADLKEYFHAFQGKVAMLNLSISEIHAARHFLVALGLGRKFMSTAMEEKTMVQGGSLDSRLTNELRRKAYALLRFARHFDSVKARGNDRVLYELFRNVTVSQSDGISKSITLAQSLEVHTVERSRANVHLEEANGQLHLSVPTDKRDRELCFLQQLPRRVLHFLAIKDPAAQAVLIQILGSSDLDTLDAVLEAEGIIEIEGITREKEGEAEGTTRGCEVESLGETLNMVLSLPGGWTETIASTAPERPRSPTPSRPSISPLRTLQSEDQNRQRHDSFFGAASSSTAATDSRSDSSNLPAPAPNLTASLPFNGVSHDGNQGTTGAPLQEYMEKDPTTGLNAHYVTITAQKQYRNYSLEELRLKDYSDGRGRPPTSPKPLVAPGATQGDASYGKLLGRIITCAESFAGEPAFPRRDQAPSQPEGSGTPKIFRFGSPNRYRKIQAAGELFALERLLSMDLPGFGVHNWKSARREEVKQCGKYSTITLLTGLEKSEFVYQDSGGHFRKELAQRGYVDTCTYWPAEDATYYLDVKTTEGPYDDLFFMDGSKLNCMKRTTRRSCTFPTEVYILLLVYNLECSNPDMLAYVDPYNEKMDGRLDFEVYRWSVRVTQPVQR